MLRETQEYRAFNGLQQKLFQMIVKANLPNFIIFYLCISGGSGINFILGRHQEKAAQYAQRKKSKPAVVKHRFCGSETQLMEILCCHWTPSQKRNKFTAVALCKKKKKKENEWRPDD